MARHFAIGDVHGCYQTLIQLLKQIGCEKKDFIIFLGDYVSKGPQPQEVIELVHSLIKKKQAIALRGNHDQKLLDFYYHPDQKYKEEQIDLGNQDLVTLSPEKRDEVISFLKHLPIYQETSEHLFVHAGFDFALADPFADKDTMLNIRDFSYDAAAAKGKTVVHGHAPKTLNEIEVSVAKKERVLNIDNGCVYKNTPSLGHLVCLELTEMKLLVQKNCD